MKPLADDQLVKLLPALAEAARAETNTATRFVAPRTGILEETAARHHQFVFGRRGVGKSTLLRKIESLGPDAHGEVIFVDIETLRGRPYPDVLIELLIELLVALERRFDDKVPRIDLNRSRRQAREGLRKLIRTLRRLLDEPQVAERVIQELHTRKRAWHLEGEADLNQGLARTRTGGEVEGSRSRDEARKSHVEESKMDGLLSAAVLIRAALANAQKHFEEGTILIVLDDFYHIPYDAQPDVLAYLHQIVKNRGIYLKICGVRHRIQPFVEDDPPRGLQLGQDAGVISLDITLERFTAAQAFLERVLSGICDRLEIKLNDLISEGGRQRLVLGSGGVARDYLSLTARALRIANERDANPSRPHNRISAEDVNEAAADLSAQKQDDLRLDAGKDADKLRMRLDDIVKFCLDVNETNVFLVEGPTLEEEDWGKEIQGLADLRLVHQIGNLSVQTGSYRGRRFVGFTLDLSNYTGTRSERIKQIEFWTATGKQGIRRAAFVYEPGAGDRKAATKEPDLARKSEELTGEWEQADIYELVPPEAPMN
jgi:energy-coupling factor transporter ATP-binding protein EcfA2